uniref:sporulation protein YqfD n=1 Tax=Acetatifactor sp. TaxID=1872090 RepID=UPI004056E2DD
MTELLKYIRGYLRIKVCGFSPERFINLCGNKDILLWDIVKEGDAYYMYISLQSFYRLRPIVKKTGTKVAILQRCGLPFFIPFLYQRKIFVLGFIMTVVFWFVSSLFIWDIELYGNYQITEDSFMTFLEQYEVKIGMRKEDLNIEAMEKEIRKTFPQITWTSAKLSGTKLLIEVKENDAPIITAQENLEEGTDLIAEYDGIIRAMIVRKGVPQVSIGEEVTKGTVLVAGSVPIYNEDATVREYKYVDADADIVLEHTRQFESKLPFDYVSKEYTGRTAIRYYLRIGDTELKMPENRPFLTYDSVIRESRPVLFDKLSIPVYFGSYTHREYQNTEHEYSLEQAESILNEKLSIFLTTLDEKGVQIIEKNVKIDTNSGTWQIKGEFLVQEPIGVSAAISKQEQDAGENSSNE